MHRRPDRFFTHPLPPARGLTQPPSNLSTRTSNTAPSLISSAVHGFFVPGTLMPNLSDAHEVALGPFELPVLFVTVLSFQRCRRRVMFGPM